MQRIASLIISIYIAALIYANAFFIKPLTIAKGSDQLFWNHLAIFLILLLPIHFLISKRVSLPSTRGMMMPLRVIFLSLALIGLILSIFYHIIPLEPVYNLPTIMDQIFVSDLAFTAWLIFPLLALFI